MKAMPLDWHENCLRNSEIWLAEQENELARFQTRMERNRKEVDFLRQQIEAAKKAGKTKFDAGTYLKARDQ